MSKQNPLKPEHIEAYDDNCGAYFTASPVRYSAAEAQEDLEEIREALRVYAEVKAQKAAVDATPDRYPSADDRRNRFVFLLASILGQKPEEKR